MKLLKALIEDFDRMDDMPEQDDNQEYPNPADVITMDVPFLIRILELVQEDVEGDAALHEVATRLVQKSQDGGVLTMEDYDDFIEFESAEDTGDEDMGDDYTGDEDMGDEDYDAGMGDE